MSRNILLKLIADVDPARRALRATEGDLKSLDRTKAEPLVRIRERAAEAQLRILTDRLERLGKQEATPRVQIVMGNTAKQIERVKRDLHNLTSGKHEVKVGVSQHGGGHGGGGGLSGLLGGLTARVGEGGAGIAAGAAGAGFGAFEIIKKLSEAYGEEQVSQARLRTQLKALNIDYEEHAKRIEEVIHRTSALSGLTGHDLNDAFVNIVRSTGKVGQSLKLVGLAADLARDKHISAAKAGQLIAKVAAGNTSALSRYGISIRKGATASEALSILQHRLAGQAAAYGKTQQGSLDRVQTAFERLKETLGQRLAPTIAKAASAVAKFIIQMLDGRGAGGKFVAVLRTIGRVVGGVARAVKSSIGAIIEEFRGGAQIIRGIVRIISGVLTLHFSRAWRGVEDVFRGGVHAVHGILAGAIAPFVAIGRSLGSGFINGVIDVVNAGIKVLNTVLGPRSLGPFGHTPDLRIGEIGHVDFSDNEPSGVTIHQRKRTSVLAGRDPRGVFSGGQASAQERRNQRSARGERRSPTVASSSGSADNISRRLRQATIDAAPKIAAAVAHQPPSPAHTRQRFGLEHIGNRLATVGEELTKQMQKNVAAQGALLPRLTDVAFHPISGHMHHAPIRHGLGAAGHVHHHEGATVQVTTPGGIQYPDAEYFASALQRKLSAKGNG